MDARVSIDKATDLTNVERKGSVFESFLHLTCSKHAKVSVICGGAAFAEFLCDSVEVVNTFNLGFKVLDVGNRLIFGASDWLVPVGVIWVSGTDVLLQDMFCTDLSHFLFVKLIIKISF